jgi:hypothetical protein
MHAGRRAPVARAPLGDKLHHAAGTAKEWLCRVLPAEVDANMRNLSSLQPPRNDALYAHGQIIVPA